MRAIVFNHGHSQAALQLRDRLRAHLSCVAIDSGSTLSEAERAAFDTCLPNVYYSGLINEAAGLTASAADNEPVFIVCSDVELGDVEILLAAMQRAFDDNRIGIYAPHATGSPHQAMRGRDSGGLRTVPFVEGFCFAARAGLLRALCPVDTRTNALGWGLDVHLGYLALRQKMLSVVDDGHAVHHRTGRGYSPREARQQRRRWLQTQLPAARLFNWLVGLPGAHSPFAARVLSALPW